MFRPDVIRLPFSHLFSNYPLRGNQVKRWYKWITVSAFSLVFLSLQAQEFSGGLEWDDEAYNAAPRLPQHEDSKNQTLPFQIDLRPFCPPIRNQGTMYSCVGWAVGYGAMTIERALQNRWNDPKLIANEASSALYLFSNIKLEDDCKRGARISDAVQFLVDEGNCLAREFDFDVNNCEQEVPPELRERAKQAAIQDYVTLFDAQAPQRLKVIKTLQALSWRKPVVVGMEVRRNFYQLRQAQYWWPEQGNTTPAGGHAMVVVGYDQGKQSFLLMNSWGTQWGDQGYIWVKYDDFGRFCKYAYVLDLGGRPSFQPVAMQTGMPAPAARPLLELSGSFEFWAMEGADANGPILRPASLSGQGPWYQMARRDWPLGQLFQLRATNKVQREYVYVFSVDPAGKVSIHWPRSAELDNRFQGINESPLLLGDGWQLIVPGKTKALKLTQAGTENLCVLFSAEKIKDIKAIAFQLSQSPDNWWVRLQQLLGNRMIPPVDVAFSGNDMSFKAQTRSGGYIVPLVLQVSSIEQ